IVFVGDIYETDVVGAYTAGIKSAWINKKNERDESGWSTYNIVSTDRLFEIIDLKNE
ncbi:MAG: HAD hydrolase-like protein, partial [Clostridiales bacterium]|nr:HAD hydrolase-like protein [Clostridiales bacterium]